VALKIAGLPPCAGRLRGSRNKLTEAVVCALLRDFSENGEKAIAEVRRKHPAAYLKTLALLIPKEHRVEHSNPLSDLSDEQLDAVIAHIQESLAQRASAAKTIEGTVEPTAVEATTLTALAPSHRKPNRLMMAADTAIGPRERRPRKHRVPSPPRA
jgi:hypothetical protein